MQPEEKVEEKAEPSLSEKLKALLDEFPNRPTAAEVDALKSTHGDVFLSALSDDEVFLFRALSRREHRMLNSDIAAEKFSPDELDEKVVNLCVLWKSVSDLEQKAGTIPSLYEQVMQNSNFLPAQLLTNLVTKL